MKFINRDKNKSASKQYDNSGSLTTKLLAAAAVVGGGYFAIKSGKINGVADYFESAGSFFRGVNRTVSSSGMKRTLFGEAQDELRENFTKSFLDAKARKKDGLFGFSTQLEKSLDELVSAQKQIGKTSIDNVRAMGMKKRVSSVLSSSYDMDDFKVNAVSDFIDRNKHDEKLFLADGDPSRRLSQLLEESKLKKQLSTEEMDVAKRKLESELKDLSFDGDANKLEEFLGANYDKIHTNKDLVDQRVKDLNKAFAQSIQENMSKGSDFSKKLMNQFGLERLTIEDALSQKVLDKEIRFNKQFSFGGEKFEKYNVKPHKQLEELIKQVPSLKDAYVDQLVFKNADGNIIDMRTARRATDTAVKGLAEHVQVPFVNIRPFEILKGMTGVNRRESKQFSSFLAGTGMPSIAEGLSKLKSDRFFFNGNLIDEYGNIVKRNQEIVSSKTGAFSRSIHAQSGFSLNKNINDPVTGMKDTFKKGLNLGYQDFPSQWDKLKGVFNKFDDPSWMGNLRKTVTDSNFKNVAEKLPVYRQYANKSYNSVDKMTKALDKDTLEILSPELKKIFGEDSDLTERLIKSDSSDNILEALFELRKRVDDDSPYKGSTSVSFSNEIDRIFEVIEKDSSAMDDAYRTFKKREDIYMPEIVQSAISNPKDKITLKDYSEKILHAEIINQITEGKAGKVTIQDIIKRSSESQAKSIIDLNVLGKTKQAKNMFYSGSTTTYDEGSKILKGLTTGDGSYNKPAERFNNIINKANPVLGYEPYRAFKTPFEGNEHVVLNRAQPVEAIKDLFNGKTSAKDFSKNVFNTMGFGKDRVGRNRLSEISNASNLSYFYLFRLNEGLSKVGLGLNYKDLGSTQDIAKNLFTKRIVAPLVIGSAISYTNDEVGNITGKRPTQLGADAYANASLGVSSIKEITGLNTLGEKISNALPGFDLLGKNPATIAARVGTFGLIGETRSPSELMEYYEEGVNPVRSGRFWSIGSSTPIYGDRIKYYKPNLYRTIQADPMMTDTMWGSTSEYWSNHWMPNPRNPLGVLKPGRRNHWVKKHKDRRPYPIESSGLEWLPIVGPMLDSTVGKIIDPFRVRPDLQKAHKEYQSEITKLHNYYKQKEARENFIYISPTGNTTRMEMTGTPVSPSYSADGVPMMDPKESVAVYEDGKAYGSSMPQAPTSMAAPSASGQVVQSTASGGFARGRAEARGQIRGVNQDIISKAYLSPINTRNIQSLRDNQMIERLDEAVDPTSMAYRLGETFYSMTEIGGLYGFMTTRLVGGDLGDKKPVLQSNRRMLDIKRPFWEAELGGLGGELSEIYRRFFPHRRRQINEYNPYRNEMPSWLPGPEYFKDYRHGDPYIKAQQGEMRLPGEAYKSLNNLHSDKIFGEYGAIERHKILGDVAPWSDQYRYYDKVVTRMNNEGIFTESDYETVQKTRGRVSERKKKYDFYNYKYNHQSLIKKKVTVTRQIDKDTFLVDEYPNNPIRLAGVKMPAENDTSADAQRARKLMGEYIDIGSKIEIGISRDPLTRVEDDTYETMHAVVYTGSGTLQKRLDAIGPMTSFATGAEGPVKGDRDSTRDVDVEALSGNFTKSVGGLWEKFAHMDTPFHTKMLQVRSPLEMYKREQVYGKAWQTWNHPIDHWIKPTLRKMKAAHPIAATITGAAVGALFGVFTGSKKISSAVGAMIGGTSSSFRAFGEVAGRTNPLDTDNTWIPDIRKEQREINDYFDKLKYMKFKGLYEKTRRLALQEEGVDPESILRRAEKTGSNNKYQKNIFGELKKYLNLNDRREEISGLQEQINYIDSQQSLMKAGPLTMKALQYKEQYKSTLQGADPYGDLMRIYRAVPKSDRPFFKEFMIARPEEREEILRLVPENQKRFYQAKWGLKPERKDDMEVFAAANFIPDEDWEGWSPDASMEEIKLKFINHLGHELTEFDFWEDDLKYAKDAPVLEKNISKGNLLNIQALKDILEGEGISDYQIKEEVTFSGLEVPEYDVDLNINIDKKGEIVNQMNKYGDAMV